MPEQDADTGPYAALRAAREVLRQLALAGTISEDEFYRAVDELEAVRQDLDAGRDARDLTVPIGAALSQDDVDRLADAVRRLCNHNAASHAARGILDEIFVIIGILRNA
jgi:HAMP domain-containing protein